MTALQDAITAHRDALTNLATIYGDTITTGGGTPTEVIEALELLRSQVHHRVDDLIDAEQLRRPSGGNAWRARRYCELRIPA